MTSLHRESWYREAEVPTLQKELRNWERSPSQDTALRLLQQVLRAQPRHPDLTLMDALVSVVASQALPEQYAESLLAYFLSLPWSAQNQVFEGLVRAIGGTPNISALTMVGHLSQAVGKWPDLPKSLIQAIPKDAQPLVFVTLKAHGWTGPGEPSAEVTLKREQVPLSDLFLRYRLPEGWDPSGITDYDWSWNDDTTVRSRAVRIGVDDAPYTPEGKAAWDEMSEAMQRELENEDFEDDRVWSLLGFNGPEMLTWTPGMTEEQKELLEKWIYGER